VCTNYEKCVIIILTNKGTNKKPRRNKITNLTKTEIESKLENATKVFVVGLDRKGNISQVLRFFNTLTEADAWIFEAKSQKAWTVSYIGFSAMVAETRLLTVV